MRRRRATQHTRRSWRRGVCWTRRTSKCGPPAAAALCVVWCCCSACCPVCVLLVLLLRGVRSRARAVAGWLLRKRHSAPVSAQPPTHPPRRNPLPLRLQAVAGRRRREITARCLYTKPITPVAGQPVDIFYNPGGCAWEGVDQAVTRAWRCRQPRQRPPSPPSPARLPRRPLQTRRLCAAGRRSLPLWGSTAGRTQVRGLRRRRRRAPRGPCRCVHAELPALAAALSRRAAHTLAVTPRSTRPRVVLL